MKRATLPPMTLVQGAAFALAAAVLGAVVLTATAKPANFNARRAALEADTAEAARLMGRSGVSAAAGAVCASADEAEAGRLQAQLVRVAQATGLENPTVKVSHAGPPARGAKLSTLNVKLEASGSYEAALRTLEQLGGLRPTVFVDTLDVSSKTSAVSIVLEGRAFCSVL